MPWVKRLVPRKPNKLLPIWKRIESMLINYKIWKWILLILFKIHSPIMHNHQPPRVKPIMMSLISPIVPFLSQMSMPQMSKTFTPSKPSSPPKIGRISEFNQYSPTLIPLNNFHHHRNLSNNNYHQLSNIKIWKNCKSCTTHHYYLPFIPIVVVLVPKIN